MKNMKKITALILAGVLCASSLSGIPAETLLASDEGNGTSTLEINFEDAVNPFVSLNNEAEDAWGIIESPVTNDTGNHLLKLTSPVTALSKYKLNDEYVSGKTIKTVSGKVAHKKATQGVYIVTDYTDETNNSGFKIESKGDNNGTVILSRVKARADQQTGLINNSSTSSCDWTQVYPDVATSPSVSCVVPFVNNTDYSYWVYFTLKYYTVVPVHSDDSGYRAEMTITAPIQYEDKSYGTQSLSLTTVVSGPGSLLMFAPAGISGTNEFVYLDDITVTMQERVCAHTNVENKEEVQYLASAGDCETFKTYYKSCADCGEAIMSETFTSEVYGAHDLTAVPEVSGDCDNAGSKAHWDCSVCEKKFYDENATEEVLKDEDLVIPAGHSWNEKEYASDATQHWHTCSKCTTASEKQAHTWARDVAHPNKLKCTTCGYVTEDAVLPMMCGTKVLTSVTDADETQYFRYDIDFSAMRDNAATYGLDVDKYGVIAVGTTENNMTLEKVLELSKNNKNTEKCYDDLTKLAGKNAKVTVKIERAAEDYGRRTTLVAFMEVDGQRYYSNNTDYTDADGTHEGIATNGIASKGVMDVIKAYLSDGPYGSTVAPDETELKYTQKAFENFWSAFEIGDYYYDVFASWGDTTKDTVKETYLDAYISGTMTGPFYAGTTEYKTYQAAKQLAVCVFCEANKLSLASSTTQ